MRFGIDFGTTHTVVALVDRGNYPIVSFEQGDAIPSMVSIDPSGALRFGVSEPVEPAVSVPANASTAQRLMTIDAYRRAGFEVKAVLNEPSAAGFEYAHRFRETVTSKREYVLVYDLGGGTFDASLIHMEGRNNEVITSSGVSRLGG